MQSRQSAKDANYRLNGFLLFVIITFPIPDIIGTWKDANAEEIFTFQENGELAVSKDMPDSGLSCGDAYYSFSYSDIICVTQGNSSVEFEIEVDQNELKIFFMGQEYLELEK